MESTLTIGSSPFHFNNNSSLTLSSSSSLPSNLRFSIPKPSSRSHSHTHTHIKVRASSTSKNNPIIRTIKTTTTALIFSAAAASFIGNFHQLPARAESPATTVEAETEKPEEEDSPLSQFLESNSEAVDALKSLLQKKLNDGEDEEALKILKRLVSSQPSNLEWKFLLARLLSEMGETEEARNVFEDILALNPLSFEALFENALLMDRRGEGEGVIGRLEEALSIAEGENKAKEARNVRLIMAQIQFLQKNVEESLRCYEELAEEDPTDFRPYFCRGMIYSLLDRNKEAREQFAKYHELSPKKFEVEGFLQTPLSRMKLFGTDSEN